MATSARYCPSCLSLARSSALPRSSNLHVSNPFQHQVRTAVSENALKYRRKDVPAAEKKRKTRSTYATPDMRHAIQFSLLDAMRYLRAAEVGREPTSSKYEIAIRLSTPKSGPVVRNRLRLPYPIKTDLRICVIAPPDSAAGKAARAAGATVIGEETVFDAVKEGRIEFDRCLCHVDSLPKLTKANLGRYLGPRGLMPSVKTNTVVKDVGSAVREMVGASEYRERLGVIRLAIGQLGFTPEEVQRNIRELIEAIRKDMAGLSDQITKDIAEVVLSSTNGPGLSLSGEFKSASSPPSQDLSVV